MLLETERLLIKAPTLADIDDWYSLHSDPEVMQYIDGIRPKCIFRRKSNADSAPSRTKYQHHHIH